MAYFAQIENNFVVNVIVISNEDCDNLIFPESEPVGQAFIASCGIDGNWLQTSYNGNFRSCYAGIGYTYDATLDEFVEPPEEPETPLEPTDETLDA
ncbi:hypothetical protein UFOVP1269_9 [uncultured Caudovirales phage]|uniref:Uncharacterized protein n=1 Tax=uncultured Caudovirales phage TaxID=2100421 RepID=A0A6J5RFT5_9CAUD|nr:hypothetical protein UFOVP1269_9 [uncultured Caudovirales phage]